MKTGVCAQIEVNVTACADWTAHNARRRKPVWRLARDHDKRELLVLEGKLSVFEPAMQRAAFNAHDAMAPIVRRHWTRRVMSAGCGRMPALLQADLANATHYAEAMRRARLDYDKRGGRRGPYVFDCGIDDAGGHFVECVSGDHKVMRWDGNGWQVADKSRDLDSNHLG
jgi:hypothetical protein